MDFRAAVGARLRKAREARKIHGIELSYKLKASHNFIGNVERGKSSLSLEKLVQICDELRITADWLLGRTKSGGPNGNGNGGSK